MKLIIVKPLISAAVMAVPVFLRVQGGICAAGEQFTGYAAGYTDRSNNLRIDDNKDKSSHKR